jgi:hypothetical protein
MGTNAFSLGKAVSDEEINLLVLEKEAGGERFEYFVQIASCLRSFVTDLPSHRQRI